MTDTYQGTQEVAKRVAIVVIGMHRSGSSAMARLLSLAGAALPETLMIPWIGNETGFWEPQRVADYNDVVLAAFDATWASPFGLGMSVHRRSGLDRFIEGARAIIREDYADAPLIVLKEPRVSLVVDLWTAALEAEGFACKFVVTVRDPREVAASLRVRDGFAFDKGLLLWAAYQASSELLTRAYDRIFCRYDDLLVRPASVLDAIEAKFGIELPRRTVQAHAEMDAFVQPSLKHNTASDAVVIAEHLQPVRDLADAIDALVAGRTADGDASQAVQDWFVTLDQIVTPLVIDVDQRRKQDIEANTALREQAIHQQAEITKLTAHAAEMERLRLEAETRLGPIEHARHLQHLELQETRRELEELRRSLSTPDAAVGEPSSLSTHVTD